MLVFDEADAAREGLSALPRPLALVPTMGALHEGHMALIRSARAECASVAASVFVNPMQFGPGEDYERYPRDPQRDRRELEAAGVDALFAPSVETMYPAGFSTAIDVGDIGAVFEGAVRPGHFRGVATVVAKLLHVIDPDVLILGQKDAQQTAVLRNLVRDLNFRTRVRVVPTVRERDGLALSSRNVYLNAEQRAAAPTLHESLQLMLERLQRGESVDQAREAARAHLWPQAAWEYLELVDARTFAPIGSLRPPAFVIGAARFSRTRLIDNLFVDAA
ncbi:MAG TPA: pantoate--beta-alanine ligase [Candidatus Baltobacteraceae bacterium]|nr:pantoate--beta-alanine ligase [Candidatus Baltobacteraceae bacterium]